MEFNPGCTLHSTETEFLGGGTWLSIFVKAPEVIQKHNALEPLLRPIKSEARWNGTQTGVLFKSYPSGSKV